MTENKKFYVTTAIDYPNAEPHIGHAYQKIIADVFARWHKHRGEDVWFLTGTDEHGKKIQEVAEKANKTPREFVDELAEKFKDAWKSLNISPNRFIRTTDKDHEKLVQEVIKKCYENGDIYKGSYEGWYCVGCEAYYTEKDLIDGKCPLHNRPLELLKEESYFFRLSKYQKFLLELFKKNPEFVLPDERRNEVISRVKEGLKDLSISRTSFDWGIPFPLDGKHIVYVWFDALFNYLSGAGKNQKYWPADVHLLGKDNAWFHCVYWPAFLKSAGYKLPKTVFVHGFLTFNGQKISKSLGNAISPKVLVEKYGADAVRYFVCRNFVFGEDGNFSEDDLVRRHNTELADKLGNLVSRVSTLAEKYGIEKTKNRLSIFKAEKMKGKSGESVKLSLKNITKLINHSKWVIYRRENASDFDDETSKEEDKLYLDILTPDNFIYVVECNELNKLKELLPSLLNRCFENYELDKALNWIFLSIDFCNEYVQNKRPWETRDKKVLYELVDSIKAITILLWPFIPSSSEKIAKQFGFKLDLNEIKKPLNPKSKIVKGEILFKKIEINGENFLA